MERVTKNGSGINLLKSCRNNIIQEVTRIVFAVIININH